MRYLGSHLRLSKPALLYLPNNAGLFIRPTNAGSQGTSTELRTLNTQFEAFRQLDRALSFTSRRTLSAPSNDNWAT